ncbi:MAG: Gfo/Idh/MocA family oxidoreductase [Chloroflexi bacterium]|nr:Gfo/Idh/MocA family oxidoreductase [Chloroflexota bacterium]
MPQFDRFRVGIIGYGIGKIHAAAFQAAHAYYPDLPEVELVSIATQSAPSGDLAALQFGFRRKTIDYSALLNDDDLNVIVVAPPNYLHFPMLLDCLRTDKAIYVDKPLTNSLDEARQVLALSRERKRDGQMAFEMRYSPALQLAHSLIQSGRLGEIYAFRAVYFRSSYADPARTLRWKGSAATSGFGVLSDLASHLIDLVIWLVGKPVRVAAQMRTFVAERPMESGKELVRIDTDDHVIVQAGLENGAVGTLEAGRMITGATNDLSIEIYGSLASLRWNLMDANYLYLADRRHPAEERGWVQIPTIQRYPGAALPGSDVPVGMMRFYIACAADFLRSTLEGRPYDPGLEQGGRVQAVIEASAAADRQNTWKEVPEIL